MNRFTLTQTKVPRCCAAGLLAAALSAGAAAGVLTEHFDLTEAPLAFFGQQWSTDFLVPTDEVRGTRIVETRVHLEFDTQNAAGNLDNAANIAVQFQAPIMDISRILSVSGFDLGWFGTGQFVGNLSTDFLNDDLLDFPPDSDFTLWFARIINLDDRNPALGGAFTNSYIEVDLVPEPASLGLFALLGLTALRRRF
jgi:hypothetical protein